MDLAHLVHPAPRRESAPPPRPLPAAFPSAALACIALGAGLAAGASLDVLLVAPVSLALFGAVQAGRRWNERRRQRAAADAWIARAGGYRIVSYSWRVDELTSARERRLLARSLRSVLDALSRTRMPGAVPLNRVALRPHEALLARLADRLAQLERPVSAAGILQVHRLLTNPDSPLYARPPAGEAAAVWGTLEAVLASLEVH
jgi:hypothetical protein